MSDWVCCDFDFIDDVTLLARGLNMARECFSNAQHYLEYAAMMKGATWNTDSEKARVAVAVADNSGWSTLNSLPTIFVSTGQVEVVDFGMQRDSSEDHADFATHTLHHAEKLSLTFKVVTEDSGQTRVMSRILLNYLMMFRRVLVRTTGTQVMKVNIAGKSAPALLKSTNDTNDRWASDIQLSVETQMSFTHKVGSPVFTGMNFIKCDPLVAQLP
jgi:hypothetical protein